MALAMSEPKTPRRSKTNEDVVCSTPSQRLKRDVAPLSNYTLGDCLGKGAYASVFRALNLGTGETVAVKQIRLVDVPKSDLESIMMEIDLLKNLHHQNIVKYHGFVKTTDTLSIILEYCENGSLSHICKKFGKFPENLVAVYIYQVLQGLSFLHQQGTIHRDIKGANILTTKDGVAKLADFGVATKINKMVGDQSVVGTPNWMAPEVIELNGATTASDIWSLGCTIVELITGKPPYHNLRQMSALFAIVNDDHPPIPEGLSPQVQDFLLQCFQKDPNLRVSANKLLRHPWMQTVANSDASKKLSAANYDAAVKSVQRWNDVLQNPLEASPTLKTKKKKPKQIKQQDLKKYSEENDDADLFKHQYKREAGDSEEGEDPFTSVRLFSQNKRLQLRNMLNTNGNNNDNWDEDFDQDVPSVNSDKQSPHTPVRSSPQDIIGENSPYRDSENDDYSDLQGAMNLNKLKLALKSHNKKNEFPQVLRPSDLTSLNAQSKQAGSSSRGESNPLSASPQPHQQSHRGILDNFAEGNEENDDYSSVFGDNAFSSAESSMILKPQRIPETVTNSGSVSSIEEAFALEESIDSNLAANAARDRIAQAQAQTQSLIGSLNNYLSYEHLAPTITELAKLLEEFPDCCKTVLRWHGLLPLLEILDKQCDGDLILSLLQCVTLVIDESLLENFSMIGGIPTVSKFASRKYSTAVRCKAASLVKLMCNSVQSLQMFISCGGLNILCELVEEDVKTQRELVCTGVEGLWRVFQLDSAPRNDLCRILSRSSILDSLVQVFLFAAKRKDPELMSQIVSIFGTFGQTEMHVKETIASRTIFRGLFKCYPRLDESHQLQVLKFIKNLSIPANFDILQNSNAIECLVDILNDCSSQKYKEIASQVLHVMFNLCRLSSSRQQEAALCGLVPILQNVVAGDMPLKQFALPILCDMAHAGKTCRKVLWNHDGLSTYLFLATDPYWQVNAYEAISTWLTDEQARVEEQLIKPENCQRLLAGLEEAKSNTLNALLETLLAMFRTSTKLCRGLQLEKFLHHMKRRLKNSKPLVRLNLLRLTRITMEPNQHKGNLLDETGLSDVLRSLAAPENPVMVRELAKDILSYTRPQSSALRSTSFKLEASASSQSTPKLMPKHRNSSITGSPRRLSPEKRR